MRFHIPGLTIETSWAQLRYWLLHLFRTEIIYSADGKLFYVAMTPTLRPKDWCTIERGNDGKHTLYPFALYEIRSGKREFVRKGHRLAVLYRSIYEDHATSKR